MRFDLLVLRFEMIQRDIRKRKITMAAPTATPITTHNLIPKISVQRASFLPARQFLHLFSPPPIIAFTPSFSLSLILNSQILRFQTLTLISLLYSQQFTFITIIAQPRTDHLLIAGVEFDFSGVLSVQFVNFSRVYDR